MHTHSAGMSGSVLLLVLFRLRKSYDTSERLINESNRIAQELPHAGLHGPLVLKANSGGVLSLTWRQERVGHKLIPLASDWEDETRAVRDAETERG